MKIKVRMVQYRYLISTFPRETVNLPVSLTPVSAPSDTKTSAPSRMNQSFLIVVEKSTWAMEHGD